MAATVARPTLHVEGPDDRHSLIHLLRRHGIPYPDRNDLPIPQDLPIVKEAGGIDPLLELIGVENKAASKRTVGFLMDADAPLRGRWAAVASRLARFGLATLPAFPPPGGFIAESPRFVRVGVWLMPDNSGDGKLEDFLRTLIPETDPLIAHAEASTGEAKRLGAAVSEGDTIKAVIHSWLAWQAKLGGPYGTAITARYFGHESPVARAFVAWFKELYLGGSTAAPSGVVDAVT